MDVLPEHPIAFDVFVANAPDLRCYQLALEASNADRPLSLEDVRIEDYREDFVFPAGIIDSSVDWRSGRVVACLRQGSVNATGMHYLATFEFCNDSERVGNPEARARISDTQLRDSAGRVVAFIVSEPNESLVNDENEGGTP